MPAPPDSPPTDPTDAPEAEASTSIGLPKRFSALVARVGWARLVGPWVVIVLAGYVGERVGVPVAWLVGPMLAAVVLSLCGTPPEGPWAASGSRIAPPGS